MSETDRRNRMIVAVLSIPLILIFIMFGPPYYESLSIYGKRVFMPVFSGVFLYLLYYVIGERIIYEWVNKDSTLGDVVHEDATDDEPAEEFKAYESNNRND